eukprot:scaffold626688_cov98-Attheya_sp.AAC.1
MFHCCNGLFVLHKAMVQDLHVDATRTRERRRCRGYVFFVGGQKVAVHGTVQIDVEFSFFWDFRFVAVVFSGGRHKDHAS